MPASVSATVVAPPTDRTPAGPLPSAVPTAWSAELPRDRDALACALAVAAAFPRHLGELGIAIAGDLEAGLRDLREDLAAGGVDEDDLPDVALHAATGPGGEPGVAGLAEAVALVAEYERRPFTVEGEPGAVWEVALATVTADPPASVVVLADGLDGAAAVAAIAPVTVVCGVPSVRRRASRLAGVDAVPRPPGPFDLPAGALVVTGCRADDLRLAAGRDRERVVVAGAVSPLVLRAFGLRAGPR